MFMQRLAKVAVAHLKGARYIKGALLRLYGKFFFSALLKEHIDISTFLKIQTPTPTHVLNIYD